MLQVAHAKKQAQTDHQIELEACNELIAFLILYRQKMSKGVINLHVLNDERRLKASWLQLSVMTAQGK